MMYQFVTTADKYSPQYEYEYQEYVKAEAKAAREADKSDMWYAPVCCANCRHAKFADYSDTIAFCEHFIHDYIGLYELLLVENEEDLFCFDQAPKNQWRYIIEEEGEPDYER